MSTPSLPLDRTGGNGQKFQNCDQGTTFDGSGVGGETSGALGGMERERYAVKWNRGSEWGGREEVETRMDSRVAGTLSY